jgi:glycosyltransferase involved in cell wall biosynthesis
MKILLLSDRIPPENAGGAEKIAWNFAVGLRELGHDVHVLAATAGQPFEETRDSIPTIHVHAKWPVRWHAWFTLYHPGVARQVAAVYERVRPDVVAAFNIHNGLTYHSLTLAHRRGIPVVAYFQDFMSVTYGKLTHFIRPGKTLYGPDDYRLPPLHNLMMMRLRYNPLRTLRIKHVLAHHVDRRLSISRELMTALGANGVTLDAVVHPGQDEADWTAPDEQVRAMQEALGISGKPTILMAGRLNDYKGSPQLLAALRRVRETIPDVRLLLLTRSSLEQQGLTAPAYADVLPHIVTGGWLEGTALAAAYRATDVIASPSMCFETLCAVNQEGMACGKPVVTTCFGGPPEVVADGVTGYVVNPLDTDVFADRLLRLLGDPAHAAALGEAGYERFRAHFVLRDRAAELAAHLEDVIRLKRQGTAG